MKIYEYLKKKREEVGITQLTLASQLGISLEAYKRYERVDKVSFFGEEMERRLLEKAPELFKEEELEPFLWRLNKKKVNQVCEVLGCFKKVKSKNMCETHYREVLKYGKLSKEREEQRQKRGKGHLDKKGYIRVRNPRTGGQTFQHRLVMEEHLRS